MLAHSAGAMVARYFARFGGADVVGTDAAAPAAGGSAVRRMVLVGPPNEGSVFAAERFMRGYPVSFLTIQPEVLATFESAYQLLPHPDLHWLVDVRGEHVARDLYDVETWREFRVAIFDPEVRERVMSRFDSAAEAEGRIRALEKRFARGLERGRWFHEAISRPASGGAGPDYLVLGSDCTSTPRYFVVESTNDRAVLRLHPDEVERRIPGVDYEALMREPGDGRVTVASLLSLGGPDADARTVLAQSRRDFAVICGRHSEMTSSPRVQRETLEFLLEPSP